MKFFETAHVHDPQDCPTCILLMSRATLMLALAIAGSCRGAGGAGGGRARAGRGTAHGAGVDPGQQRSEGGNCSAVGGHNEATVIGPLHWLDGYMLVQAEAAELRKQMEELRTQLQRNEEMVRWLNNQVRGAVCKLSCNRILQPNACGSHPPAAPGKGATTGATGWKSHCLL